MLMSCPRLGPMGGEVQLRQLEYVVALARERHFARAATRCFVSQPALSAGIRKLETELDVTIVQRGQRFEGFTPEGQLVVNWAHRILAERDGLRADLQQLRGGLTSTLRIGTIPTAVAITSLVTERFTATYPMARARVEEMSSREVSRRLVDFQIDVGVTYLDAEGGQRHRTVELYRERYFLVCPDGTTTGTAKAVVGWDEAARLELCLLSRAMRNRRIIDERFAAAGAVPAPVVETDSMGALLAHISSRQLATVVSQAWLYAFGVPEGMGVHPLTHDGPGEAIGLVTLDSDPLPYLAEACVAAVTGLDVESELDRAIELVLTS